MRFTSSQTPVTTLNSWSLCSTTSQKSAVNKKVLRVSPTQRCPRFWPATKTHVFLTLKEKFPSQLLVIMTHVIATFLHRIPKLSYDVASNKPTNISNRFRENYELISQVNVQEKTRKSRAIKSKVRVVFSCENHENFAFKTFILTTKTERKGK